MFHGIPRSAFMATLCSAVTSAVSSDFKRSSLADLERPFNSD